MKTLFEQLMREELRKQRRQDMVEEIVIVFAIFCIVFSAYLVFWRHP